MKCLTIKEPWASLIINGLKEYEFRTWKTTYRGKVLIHTSQKIENKYLNRFAVLGLQYQPGFIIGEAEIVDCIPITNEFEKELIKKNELVYGNNQNRTGYAWVLKNIKSYDKPIKTKGKLGLWNYK